MSTASGTNSASHSGTSKPRRTFERTRGDDSSDYIYVSDSGIMTSGNIYRVPSHSSIPGFPIGSKRWSELPPPPPDMESAGPSMSKASKRKSVGEAFIQAGAYIRDLRKSNSFNNGPASIKGAEYTSSPNALSRPSSVSSSSSKTGLPRVFSAPNVASLQQRPASAIGNRQISPLSSGARNVPAVGKRGSATGADGDRGRWSIGAPDPNSASAMLTFRSRSVDYTDRGGSMFVDGGDDVGETQGQYVPGHPGWHSAFAMYSPAAMTPQMLPGMMDSAGSVFADGEEEHTTMQRPPPMPSMGFTRIPGAVGVFPGYASPVYHDSRMSSPRRPNSVGGMQMPMASIGGMFADGDDFPTTERPRFSFMGDDADGDADEDDERSTRTTTKVMGSRIASFRLSKVCLQIAPLAARATASTSIYGLLTVYDAALPSFSCEPTYDAVSSKHGSYGSTSSRFPSRLFPSRGFPPWLPTSSTVTRPRDDAHFSDEASNSSSIYYAASSRAASPGAFRVAVGGAQSGDESDSVQAPMSALPTITEANDEERGVEQKQTKRSKRTDASKKDAKLRFIGNGVVPITTQPLSSNTPNSVLGNILGMDVDNAQPPSSTSTTASTQFNEPTHPTRSTISPSSTRSLQRPSGNRPPRVSNGSVPSAANTLTSDTSSSSPRSSSTKPRPTVSTLDHARSIVRDIEEEVQRALSPVVPPSPVYRKEDMTKMVEMIEDEVRKSFAVSTPSSTGMLSAAAEGKEVTYVAVDSMERTVDVKGFSGGNGGKGVKEDVVGKKKGWWKR
ncbi:hypothetical protein BC829DRAFT_466712 [Chytridium lagenaria]|nr:hypothetical protein BC829DRAFT_466712 [Chytridium lagenaria]